jgi:hypothetical protein
MAEPPRTNQDNARMVAAVALLGLSGVIFGWFLAAASKAGWFVAIARSFAALQGSIA